jgi:hypothetical protein
MKLWLMKAVWKRSIKKGLLTNTGWQSPTAGFVFGFLFAGKAYCRLVRYYFD